MTQVDPLQDFSKFAVLADVESNNAVNDADVDLYFKLFLNRPVDDAPFVSSIVQSKMSRADLAQMLLRSPEFLTVLNTHIEQAIKCDRSPTLAHENYRVLLVGSCLMYRWKEHLSYSYSGSYFDFVTHYNASILPPLRTEDERYDFQIVQVALRSILPEAAYFRLDARDYESYEDLFAMARSRIDANINAILRYAMENNVVSFVLGFMPPQQNPLGRFQQRYDLTNMVCFVEEANKYLLCKLREYPHAHYVDLGQIVSDYGKKYFQDDSVTHFNHGAAIATINLPGDEARLEEQGDIENTYAPRVGSIMSAAYDECLRQFKSIN